MKILKIALANLNSLRGSHVVDFEAEPLASGGLFAITGPTGAGKTTLLDAMTLALYGHAARYGKDANPEEMMSRHTGECSAEVTFQVARGRYRAEWKLKRARGKSDGNIQSPKRYLYDADGNVLAQSLTDVKENIEELVGLNYERFLRSVLLAQGDFALFLKAKSGERAEILESLTGTIIYSELGSLAFEEAKRRTDELNVQKEALGQTVLLTEEERAEHSQQIETQSITLKSQQDELKILNDQLAKSANLSEALKGEQECLEVQAALDEKRKEQEPKLQKLKEHRATLPFTADLNAVIAAESAISEQQGYLQQTEADQQTAQREWLCGLVSAREFSKRLLTVSQAAVAHWKEETDICQTKKRDIEAWLVQEAQDKTLTNTLPEISAQLSQLEAHRASFSPFQDRLKRITARIGAQQKAIEELAGKLAKAKEYLATTEKKNTGAGAQSKAILDGKSKEVFQEELDQQRQLERGLDQLTAKAENLANRQNGIAQQRADLDELKPQIETKQKEEKAAIEARATAEKDKLLRKDHLEKATLIADLQDHRASLKEGEECPLCGATEHPLITGECTPTAMNVLREELIKAEQSFQEKDTLCQTVGKILAGLLSTQVQLTKAMEAAEKEVSPAQSEIQALADLHRVKHVDVESLNKAKHAQTEKIEILKQHLLQIDAAITEAAKCETEQSDAAHKVDLILGEVRSGNDALIQLQEAQKLSNEEIANLHQKTSEVSMKLNVALKPYQIALPEAGFETSCQKVLSARAAEYQKQNAQLGAISTALDKAHNQLEKSETESASLGGKSASFHQQTEKHAESIQEISIKESPQLLATWQEMEEAEKSLRDLQATIATAETTFKNCSEAMARADKKWETLTAALHDRVELSSFSTINQLRMCQLETGIFQEYETLEKSLESEGNMLKGALEQRRKEIKELRVARVAEGEEAFKLTTRQIELQEAFAALSEQLGAMKNALQQDNDSRKTHAAKLVEIEELEKGLNVWRQLRDLIGSQDGKKFSRYAQGISLEVLVYHGNEHLQRLTRRYSMRRRPTQELDLEIVDHDQADATRPMASLSGGESFITSLALALGLANMAGRNTRIDSLFVDEGFGSLDADSLDLAISALESLRKDNKTIGVISHVDLLKERIAVQIAVQKRSGGISTISILPAGEKMPAA